MAKGYVTLPVGYERVDNLPLLVDQVFSTYSEASSYAAGSTAYVGQVIAITEDDYFGLYLIDSSFLLVSIGEDLKDYNISLLINDSGYLTEEEVASKISDYLGEAFTEDYFYLVGTTFYTYDQIVETPSLVTTNETIKAGAVILSYDNDISNLYSGNLSEILCIGTDDSGNPIFELIGSYSNYDLSLYYTKGEIEELISSSKDLYSTNIIMTDYETNEDAEEGFQVQLGDGEVGGYSTGDFVAYSETLYSSVKNLLQKEIPPTYTAPTITGTTTVFGTTVELDSEAESVPYVLAPYGIYLYPGYGVSAYFYSYDIIYNQNDGGSATVLNVTDNEGVEWPAGEGGYSDVDISSGEVVGYCYPTTITVVEDFQVDFTVSYEAGEVKQTNLGNDYATGQITAGDVTASCILRPVVPLICYSGTINFSSSFRELLGVYSFIGAGYLDNEDVLLYEDPTAQDYVVNINEGSTCVCIAFPTGYKATCVRQGSSGFDILSAFTESECQYYYNSSSIDYISMVSLYLVTSMGFDEDTLTITLEYDT